MKNYENRKKNDFQDKILTKGCKFSKIEISRKKVIINLNVWPKILISKTFCVFFFKFSKTISKKRRKFQCWKFNAEKQNEISEKIIYWIFLKLIFQRQKFEKKMNFRENNTKKWYFFHWHVIRRSENNSFDNIIENIIFDNYQIDITTG